jgi:hypothetical protein
MSDTDRRPMDVTDEERDLILTVRREQAKRAAAPENPDAVEPDAEAPHVFGTDDLW